MLNIYKKENLVNNNQHNKMEMKNEKILKLTLEEYGYELDKLIFTANGLIMAIKFREKHQK